MSPAKMKRFSEAVRARDYKEREMKKEIDRTEKFGMGKQVSKREHSKVIKENDSMVEKTSMDQDDMQAFIFHANFDNEFFADYDNEF